MLEKLNNYENMEKKSMKINPLGAKIEELILGGQPIFYFGNRGDGKLGVTHPCTPNFGKDMSGIYNLPQHGPMRNSECKVLENTPEKVELSYEIVHENFPKGVLVNQKFSLENNAFIVETTHTNNSQTQVPINFGEHCYFNAPQGWEGIKINGEDVTEKVKKNETIVFLPFNTIQIPGVKDIILIQRHLNKAVLWAYQNEKGEYDKKYVCIEPLMNKVEIFGKPESMIEPKKTISSLLIIKV